MSLLQCPQCGNQVSDHAEMCPRCGCLINETLKSEEVEFPAQKTRKKQRGLSKAKRFYWYVLLVAAFVCILIVGISFYLHSHLRSNTEATEVAEISKEFILPTAEPTPEPTAEPTATPSPTQVPEPRIDGNVFTFDTSNFLSLYRKVAPVLYKTTGTSSTTTIYQNGIANSNQELCVGIIFSLENSIVKISDTPSSIDTILAFAVDGYNYADINDAIISVCDPSLTEEERTDILVELGIDEDGKLTSLSGEGVESVTFKNEIWYAIIKTPGYNYGDWLFQISAGNTQPDGTLPDGSDIWIHEDGRISGSLILPDS